MELSGDLNARSIDAILASPLASWPAANKLVVDMSRVSVAKPAGACLFVCLLAHLVEHRRDCRVPVEILRPPRAVSSYLATLGFFSALNMKVLLIGCDDLLDEDRQRRARRGQADRARAPGAVRDMSVSRTAVLPMQFLPASPKGARRWEFENNCQAFVNSLVDKFEHLFQSGHIAGRSSVKGFLNANLELVKNVFDHSEGWGLAAISASPRLGVTATFHDVGIGIPTAVRRCPGHAEDTDEATLRWSLIEGNSSRPGNSGLGLDIVQRLVADANGTMEIRSGICRLRHAPGSADWQSTSVPSFAGAHVSLHIPPSS